MLCQQSKLLKPIKCNKALIKGNCHPTRKPDDKTTFNQQAQVYLTQDSIFHTYIMVGFCCSSCMWVPSRWLTHKWANMFRVLTKDTKILRDKMQSASMFAGFDKFPNRAFLCKILQSTSMGQDWCCTSCHKLTWMPVTCTVQLFFINIQLHVCIKLMKC